MDDNSMMRHDIAVICTILQMLKPDDGIDIKEICAAYERALAEYDLSEGE